MTMRDPAGSLGTSRINATITHPGVVGAVARRLTDAGVPSAAADARWLVERVIEVAGEPSGCGAALLDGLVARRVAREPLQLILGSCAFRTVEIEVRAGVFIPRPETEITAGIGIEAALARGPAPVVVEPCTGSGPILCSLLAEVPDVRVSCTDVDPDAVALARQNLAHLVSGRAGRARPAGAGSGVVSLGSLFEGVDPTLRGSVDVVVCNPPYLPASDRGSWEPEVAAHDPVRALVGGADGEEVVVAILREAFTWLRGAGAVVIEIDPRRAESIRSAADSLGYRLVRLHRDLTGALRVLSAETPDHAGQGAASGAPAVERAGRAMSDTREGN